ncbi:hypothetical protein CEXT_796601 [Caerostris extrusa]|uniref:Uncharacterized protein n=1 Tax=Caerostris extrusa TaxID=172846 RepID=A0AAV4WTL5_CAEEX|nr:hypothetical protein CEXT_796601 [Caerostris extrusa]
MVAFWKEEVSLNSLWWRKYSSVLSKKAHGKIGEWGDGGKYSLLKFSLRASEAYLGKDAFSLWMSESYQSYGNESAIPENKPLEKSIISPLKQLKARAVITLQHLIKSRFK